MKYDATIYKQSAWRMLWHVARDQMNNAFPVCNDYHMSLWAMWEDRIKNGHSNEQKWIEKRYEELKGCPDVPEDLFYDDYSQMVSLTNSMYATLVVSIWAEMEVFLKSLIRSIYNTTGKSKKVPYRFDDIKKAIKDETGMYLERCASYSTVNAIRLLNNKFKHDNGYCDPKRGDYKEIKKSPIAKVAIPDRRKSGTKWRGKKIEIEYSKLSIQELLNACNAFYSVLLDRVEKNLEKKCASPGSVDTPKS